MAERRMFAKSVVLSDRFLDLPFSARALYLALGMDADDDGFVNHPKSVLRQCGAAQEDMALLAAQQFILPFDSGVVAIRHWHVNNTLRRDRYTPTRCQQERALLKADKAGAYRRAEEND